MVEVWSFLLLDLLLENADLFGLGNLDSEELSFWIIIEKQAVERARECRHRRKPEGVVQIYVNGPMRNSISINRKDSDNGLPDTRSLASSQQTNQSSYWPPHSTFPPTYLREFLTLLYV